MNARELWSYRELLFFLVWRDVRVRYKQTAVGALWAILQPVLLMIIFSVIFEYVGLACGTSAPTSTSTTAPATSS